MHSTAFPWHLLLESKRCLWRGGWVEITVGPTLLEMKALQASVRTKGGETRFPPHQADTGP